MRFKKRNVLLLLNFLYTFGILAQPLEEGQVDVLNYEVYLEPNISEQYINGNVLIKFQTTSTTYKVVFDAGNLTVTKLEGKHTKGFQQKGKKVTVALEKNGTTTHEIRLFYTGKPKRGLVFLNNPEQVYSVFFTSEWMICNAAPDDRATLKLDLLVPNSLISVGSGVLQNTVLQGDNKTLYSWCQDYETPAYTYGFTIGTFHHFEHTYKDIHLKFYAEQHTAEELEKIFQYTGDMLSFFEEKAGIPFPQNAYSQVLIGNHYQEMSGFAILKKSYGELVLNDSTETNLISHELAHQWWGNRITCKNWRHFWLNEGLATFMSAAYNEHHFGKEKYQQNIDSYFKVYDKIKSKGDDKPLVFPNWSNPFRDDRNLVYFKGAYVLHLLREELGDEHFWKGIKHFTQKYIGKSVITKDFQSAMEASSGRKLTEFFDTWVY